MREIKEYTLESNKQAAYIPILDEEPSFAAKFLTKKDLEKAYEVLKETFKEIKMEKPFHLPLYETILNSRFNFMWFVNFLREIEVILGKDEYKINFKRCPSNAGKELEVYQPFKLSIRKGLRCLAYSKRNVEDQPFINNYRIKYIEAGYDLSEFQDDQYPGWYLLKDTVVFEQYNEKTNIRVKIEFRDSRFYYFVAGASDNWLLIEDVPKEMDNIVSALLFRNVL